MNRQTKLIISLALDIIGWGSYALPGVGEISDIIVAPITAGWIWYAYGMKKGALLGFAEEILPYTDIIPSCTIAHWLTRKK